MIKRIILSAIITLGLAIAATAQQAPERLFLYPEPPEDAVTLQQRCDYLVEHFWDKCNFPAAVRSRENFRGAFADYISFMPYASSDVVMASIDRLISAFAKDPDSTLMLAELAEEQCYNPDGEFVSDDIFLPFARAAVAHKKIAKNRKSRLAYEVQVLERSAVGQKAPEVEFTRPDGTKGRLSEQNGYVLMFINDPDCEDCAMARVRLSASTDLNDLIDAGLITVLSIYPSEYSTDWAESVSHYNHRWQVGAAPDIDENYDLRFPPVFYYIDSEGTILSKSLVTEKLLDAFHKINTDLTR